MKSHWIKNLIKHHNSNAKVSVWVLIGLSAAILAIASVFVVKQQSVEGYVDSASAAEQGMTLWQVLQSGGIVMIILTVLSAITIGLITYFFLRLRTENVVPADFSHEIISKVHTKKFGVVREMCLDSDNMVSGIVMAGMDRLDKGYLAAKESIEIKARKEMALLWEGISYLSDIAAIAPMLGLLGTVIGMIQAFNTIAFQSAVVKPVLLAAGVSKAMVTTAAGMAIAILAMTFYSFFRSRVQIITDRVETVVLEVLDAISHSENSAA